MYIEVFTANFFHIQARQTSRLSNLEHNCVDPAKNFNETIYADCNLF